MQLWQETAVSGEGVSELNGRCESLYMHSQRDLQNPYFCLAVGLCRLVSPSPNPSFFFFFFFLVWTLYIQKKEKKCFGIFCIPSIINKNKFLGLVNIALICKHGFGVKTSKGQHLLACSQSRGERMMKKL